MKCDEFAGIRFWMLPNLVELRMLLDTAPPHPELLQVVFVPARRGPSTIGNQRCCFELN